MYELFQDNDGHWFVIPSGKCEETEKYFERLYKYMDEMPDDEDEPEEPEWLEEVGGSPSLVKFSNYVIE
jgi:hypothetical protein